MQQSGASMTFNKSLEKELKRFARTSPEMLKEGMAHSSILFITHMVEGKYGTKPPLKDGFLRGSFSTFVDGKYLNNPQLTGDKSYQVNTSDIDTKGFKTVWVSNMPYANRMENGTWTPGERSAEDGDVGNHFFAQGLKNGAEDWGQYVALRVKKSMDAQGRDVGGLL